MKRYFEKLSAYSIPYDPKVFNCRGQGSIHVLPELTGKPWNALALGLVHGLEPTAITITTGETTCDCHVGRVTVIVDRKYIIKEITQEVSVGLLPGMCGSGDLMERIKTQ